MSAADMDVKYASDAEGLVAALESANRPGTFYAYGTREVPMPSLLVDGVGRISIPLLPDQVARLVETAAERAPFGLGERTVYDESVRKVWQIDPEVLSISGQGWKKAMEGILADVLEALGLEAGSAQVDLYKLLVYDEGGHFAAHRDTEKAEGMFGTLVVSLPSEHTGGLLSIRHAGGEVNLDLCPRESAEIRFAAFYADCEHEVAPVLEGYRVCLVYNLVRTRRGRSPGAPDDREAIRMATDELTRWAAMPFDPQFPPRRRVYLLQHRYTPSSLSLAELKGADAALGKVLHAAAASAGCRLVLAQVRLEEYGYFESWYPRGEDPDESDMDDAVVDDGWNVLDTWRELDGRELPLGEVRFEPGQELLPPGALDAERPDRLDFENYTGNEGATFSRAYLRAALVFWPESDTAALLESAGWNAVTGALGHLLRQSGKTVSPLEVQLVEAGLHLLEESCADVKGMPVLLRAMVRLGRPDECKAFWEGRLLEIYRGEWNREVAALLRVVPAEEREPMLYMLFDRHGPLLPRDCLELWWFAVKGAGDASARYGKALTGLLQILPQARQHIRARFEGYDSFVERVRNPSRWSWVEESENADPCFPPDLLVQVLNRFLETGKEMAVEDFLQGIRRNPEVFSVEDFFLPACLHHSRNARPPVKEMLWCACAEMLLGRSEHPPEKPSDWLDSTPVPETGEIAEMLLSFLRDPEAPTLVYRARQDLRSRMEALVRRYQLDLDLKTERKGSPHRLCLTKNRASYHAAVRRFQQDLRRMRSLLESVPARNDSGMEMTTLTEKLQKTLKTYLP